MRFPSFSKSSHSFDREKNLFLMLPNPKDKLYLFTENGFEKHLKLVFVCDIEIDSASQQYLVNFQTLS